MLRRRIRGRADSFLRLALGIFSLWTLHECKRFREGAMRSGPGERGNQKFEVLSEYCSAERLNATYRAQKSWEVQKEWLRFEYHRRPADSLRLKSDCHLDTVRDLDKGNAAVHSVVFAVKGHGPFDLASTFALAVGR